MHDHSVKEDAIKEIKAAFIAQDTGKKGYVSTQEAKNILTQLGDGLSRQEGRGAYAFVTVTVELNSPFYHNSYSQIS